MVRKTIAYKTGVFKITSNNSLESGEKIKNTKRKHPQRRKGTEKQEVPVGTPFLAACCEDDDKVALTKRHPNQVDDPTTATWYF